MLHTPLPNNSSELKPVSANGLKIIASSKSNKLISDDKIVAQIKPGITTKAQVASLLGESGQVTIDKVRGGTHWSYLFYEIYSSNDINQVVLFLWFDDSGVLKPKPDGMIRQKTIVAGGKTTTLTD